MPKRKSVTERMKKKHDDHEEEMKKFPFALRTAIRAKRRHKKALEEGIGGLRKKRKKNAKKKTR